MTPATTRSILRGRRLPGVLLLALLLTGGLWAANYFSAEARVRRATVRIVERVQKAGAESPVALGLSASRLGNELAAGAVLELEGHGPLTTGRKEIVQLYAQVRNASARIRLEQPRVAAVVRARGEVQSFVDARYRLETDGGEVVEGAGQAVLRWRKGEDGWQAEHVRLKLDPSARLPKGWQ